jgi:P27 family predicted phage terminase small subunit
MRGDKPKPAALKILRMTAKKAEKLIGKVTPTPGPLVEPPDWFTADQKTDWNYAIENAPRDVLRRIDKAVLAGFIVAQDTHRKAVVALQQSQLLVKTPKQALPMQNPYLPIVNRQMVLMMRAASELGFTPCARARIDAGNPSVAPAGDWDSIETG